ncbi:MAG: aldo/keto reductase [Spirochaetia bacterium]|jgi:predicted aldo/keto reductase-like oxidoreductase
MRYRSLGSSGISISEISLGVLAFEYHERSSDPRTMADAVRLAMDSGVNFIDLPVLKLRDVVGEALRGIRNRVLISGHLGCCSQNATYFVSRNPGVCEASFHDLLTRLGTDHVDILMLHNVDQEDDYANVFDADGFLGLALRLKREGKARVLGLSTHMTSIAVKAIETGCIEAIMFPVNPAHDLLPGTIGYDGYFTADSYNSGTGKEITKSDERQALYHTCLERGIGLIAMKPYAGGLLLAQGRFIVDDAPISDVRSAVAFSLTPAQCLSYVLSQPGVSTALPGCGSVEEVKAALSYLDATPAERDYSAIDSNALWKLRGRCVYCNHCLPCPEGIDIGGVMRLLDAAVQAPGRTSLSEYHALSKDASDCTSCGECQERCPFGVAIIDRMEQARELFGIA